MNDCSLCGAKDIGFGNNPAPLLNHGEEQSCCDKCNLTKVIPARLALYTDSQAKPTFYVVVENGEAYPNAYKSFIGARTAVKEKHRETIEEQIQEAGDEPICSEVDVPENSSGKTYLYVEKGIHIYIHRFEL